MPVAGTGPAMVPNRAPATPPAAAPTPIPTGPPRRPTPAPMPAPNAGPEPRKSEWSGYVTSTHSLVPKRFFAQHSSIVSIKIVSGFSTYNNNRTVATRFGNLNERSSG